MAKRGQYSGTFLLFGLILIGFLVAWRYGGFPSILLPSFLLLAIGIPVDLFNMICESAPKKEPKPVNPLRGIFIIVIFYLFFAWCFELILPCFQGPNLNKILRKVEYPFSEASHVVADSKGSIYVHSQFNKRIQKYSKDGRFQFGWFGAHRTQKHSAMAIDENDYIYTYWNWIIRKYDGSGNMISEIRKSREARGWWRLIEDSAVWDPNAREPGQFDMYNTVVKEGSLLPGTELKKNGFKTADARYYKLTRLWFLFPVVSVDRYLSRFKRYILPNPVSLPFTFVFPGFLFYAFVLFLAWALEKPAERLTKRFLASAAVTVVIFIIAAAAIVVGGTLVMYIANAQPENSPWRFWLVPIVVIPYWIIVIIAAFWSWRVVQRRLHRIGPDEGDEGS